MLVINQCSKTAVKVNQIRAVPTHARSVNERRTLYTSSINHTDVIAALTAPAFTNRYVLIRDFKALAQPVVLESLRCIKGWLERG